MAVRVLGPLDTGSEALSPRERAILTALIVRVGSTVSPSELADALWGDEVPPTWGAQVKNSVARIRSRLGRMAIETVGSEYRLGLDPTAIDSVTFERTVSAARGHALRGDPDRAVDAYRRALLLWRGAPYQDVATWEPAMSEAMRLNEIRKSAQEELLEARLRKGDARSVIADAEALVREEPLREERWAVLALANYQAGRQAEALATLRAARGRLDDELGIEPGTRLTELETAILRQDASLAPAVLAPQVSAACPYRGLSAFGPDDAEVFFGRDADTEVILGRVAPGTVVTIAGPSGSGKSSVLLAGVLVRLTARGRRTRVVRPGAAGLSELRAAIAAGADVIGLDQAEELFTVAPEIIDEFCATAAAWLAEGGCLVATIRSDFLDRATGLPHLGVELGRTVHVLAPLSAAALREAIEKPASEAGLRLEPGLVELMLRDAGGRQGVLPLVSHALVETWVRREGSTLTIEGYETSGAIAGAISQSAEQLYRALPPHEQDVCRSIVLRLIERDADGTTVRRRAPLAPLLEDSDRRRVIESLVTARLATVDGDALVIAHEAVATAWPRLDDWLQTDAEGARLLRVVESAAAQWDASGRPEDDLLRGARLHTALDWREASRPHLTAVETAFLDHSAEREEAEVRGLEARALKDRAQNRRLRWALAGAASLLVVALVSGSIAAFRGQEASEAAQEQRIEALAATSLVLRDTDRDLAALLAAELHRRWPDDSRARSAIWGNVTGAGGLVSRLVYDEQTRLAGAVIPGTRTVLSVRDTVPESGPDEEAPPAAVSVIDLGTGETVRELTVILPPSEFQREVSVSADGSTAVIQSPAYRTPGDGGTCCLNRLDVIDLERGSRRLDTIEIDSRTSSVRVSADGATAFLIHPMTADPLTVDTTTGAIVFPAGLDPAEYEGSTPTRNGFAVTDDGRLLVGTEEGVAVYDAASLQRTGTVTADPGYTESLVREDGVGGLLVSGSSGLARIDPSTGLVLWSRSHDGPETCWDAEVVASTASFLCVGTSGRVQEHLIETGEPTGREFPNLSDWIAGIDLLPDETEFVAFLNRHRPALMHWRLDGSAPVAESFADGRMAAGGFGKGDALVVMAERGSSPDGQLGRWALWDTEADVAVGEDAGGITWISSNEYERWEEDTGAVIADATTGEARDIPREPDDTKDFYLHDGGHGPHAFIVEDARIVPIDPTTGERAGPSLTVPDVHFMELLLSLSELPASEEVAITWFDAGRATSLTAVFDLRTGKELRRGLANDQRSIATPEGDIISANASRLSRSSVDLTPQYALAKSGVAPIAMQVTADGRTMLLSGYDERITLYDLRDGRKLGSEVESLSADPGYLSAGFLSSDGTRMVTNTERGALMWDLRAEALFEATCRLAGRELTALEWRTYFGDEPQVKTCATVLSR